MAFGSQMSTLEIGLVQVARGDAIGRAVKFSQMIETLGLDENVVVRVLGQEQNLVAPESGTLKIFVFDELLDGLS